MFPQVNGKQLSECLDAAYSWPDAASVVSFAKEAWQCVSRRGDDRPRLPRLIDRLERLDVRDDEENGPATDMTADANVNDDINDDINNNDNVDDDVNDDDVNDDNINNADNVNNDDVNDDNVLGDSANDDAADAEANSPASPAASPPLSPSTPRQRTGPPSPAAAQPPPSVSASAAAAAATAAPSAAAAAVHEVGRECMICASAPVQTRFLPCRHSLTCLACASLLRARGDRCPVDRSRISNIETGQFQVTYGGE